MNPKHFSKTLSEATRPVRACRSQLTREALQLIAPFLDAKSLAVVSCVSNYWRAALADDHLWEQHCRSHYPSTLSLPLPDDDASRSSSSSSPHRRLFDLFHSAYTRRRALPAPLLALADVTFAIDLFVGDSVLSFAVAADEDGVKNAAGVFEFRVDMRARRNAVAGAGEWRIRWTAVRSDLGVSSVAFVMMDAKVPPPMVGTLGGGGRVNMWASEKLPVPCCGGARLEADVHVEVGGEEERSWVETVRFGVMFECAYIDVDAGLRFLQHFLL